MRIPHWLRVCLCLQCVLLSLAGMHAVSAQQSAVTAIPASRFLNSIGTQSAISVRGENFQKTIECVKFLGVRWLRAGIEGNVPIEQFVELHKQAGVKFSWGLGSGGTDLAKFLITARQMADSGALLSFEGPNEPNNWGITYQGQAGGRDKSWIPVANLMRDLHKAVKSDPALKPYPVWSITENGAETDNVGLQFLTIPPGAHTAMPDGTIYADYANVHNYIYHPNSPGVEDNKTWKAADPGPACKVDGLFGEYGVTWAKHYPGYSEHDLLTLPRVTTETGCNIDGAVTEDIQGLNLLSLYLDQFKRGWSYTSNYLMRDRVDEAGNQQFGFFKPDYTPRKAAVYLHNLTTILADTGVRAASGQLEYSIKDEPPTAHDMLLQKSDGTFELIVWGERVKGSDDVSISLGRTFPVMKLYDVTQGTSPQLTLNGVSDFELTLTDRPKIIELPPGAPKPRPRPAAATAFPLKVSANGRYLVDRRNVPFLIAGDVPQSLMVQLSPAEADAYFADRQRYGFNTLWINVVNAAPYFPDSRANGSTFDGILPFSSYISGGKDLAHFDLSKPNEAYFKRVDEILDLTAKRNLLVFLDPIETGQWLTTLRNNGVAAASGYGAFLGNRYKKYKNILWLNGNDFSSWKGADDEVVEAVAKGIKSSAPDQLQTVELMNEQSLQDPTWRPIIAANGCYTYSCTYLQMLQCWRQSPAMPAYLLESHYENEDVGTPPDFGIPSVVRRQAYWAMLSGGKGQLYGNQYTWKMQAGWKDHIDTPGADQFKIWKDLFTSLPWYNLAPDEKHNVVTSGLGTMGDEKLRVSQSDFCTTASTPDGTTIVAYMPTMRTVTVNMTSLKSRAIATWFDPTNGGFVPIPGQPLANTGSHEFTPPGKNAAGDGDWVLVISADKHP